VSYFTLGLEAVSQREAAWQRRQLVPSQLSPSEAALAEASNELLAFAKVMVATLKNPLSTGHEPTDVHTNIKRIDLAVHIVTQAIDTVELMPHRSIRTDGTELFGNEGEYLEFWYSTRAYLRKERMAAEKRAIALDTKLGKHAPERVR
jgi:hypothetical protein